MGRAQEFPRAKATPRDAEPAVEIRELVKHYGATPVLRGINLTIAAGTSVALFGANGAGKSTLLNLIATLARPTSGTIRVCGFDSVDDGPRARGCAGMLSHAPWVYDRMSVRDNIRFFAKLRGIHLDDAEILDALAEMDLDHVADDDAGTLSRGMKQRLGIVRAFLGTPALLLMDEPFTGLDRKSADLLCDQIGRFRQAGGTILTVTHAISEGWRIADRALVLHRGRLVQDVPVSPDGLESFAAQYDDRMRGEDN
ncbi:MAG: Sulfate/thiosulfate import ATP-binding protein CysA [Candidatus Latescibacteria bacterium ADurb.Bin168]|nr:MAG: Sulfate/thiosulfate import ATP-binding protein CysA [Candidatus Latescibacteria bacterium ADurb.Bin168]